jgi:asparagine synthase (glutamine-hydrolysing)
MFAIALWDKKKETLFLIRDRMGVKPLFYAPVNNNIIFGSEIKTILQHPDYKKEPSFEGLYHYFTFKNVPAPWTAFKGIYSLHPGEMIIFKNGKIEKNKYWNIKFSEKNMDETYIIEKINTILEDATRLRMKCDVPFGAYLSGGVDSSVVVSLMTRYSDRPVKTFSLGYEDELKNKEADLYYARKVSQAYKTEHYEYIMSCKELVDDIENVIGSFDQPFSGTISTFFLSKLIKEHVIVALSGDGADELFGSYLSHRAAQPMYYFTRLYEKIKAGTLAEEEKKFFLPCDMKFLENLFDKSLGDEALWRYHISLFSDEEKRKLLTDEFKSGTISSCDLLKENFKNLTSKDPLNRMLEMEWNTQFPDQVLAFVDFLSMAHSIEIRSPFIDYRLVEFVSTISGNLKIRNGNVKDILKRSVEHLLPEGITKRPKEGFVLPIFDWMVEKMKDFSMDVLSEKRLKKHNFFNKDVVKNTLESYYKGNRTNAGRVWNLMMFQVWWERYFC